MNGNIVHAESSTRHFLTVEKKEGGVISAVLANLDGSPIQHDGMKYPGDHPAHVEVYLDTISGNHFAKITAAQMSQRLAAGEIFYQGVGGVAGWFVPAPDFTLAGRHGDKFKAIKAPRAEAAQYGGPPPVEASQAAPALAAPARAPRKNASKKK